MVIEIKTQIIEAPAVSGKAILKNWTGNCDPMNNVIAIPAKSKAIKPDKYDSTDLMTISNNNNQ
jgi:hypothetical protein